MQLEAPDVIVKTGIVGAKPAFRWNTSITDDFVYRNDAKLLKAYSTIKGRAAYGFVVALSEWLVWRVEGRVTAKDHADLLRRIEAGWVAANEPSRVEWTDFPWNDRAKDTTSLGVAMLATMFLEDGLKGLRDGIASSKRDTTFSWAAAATLAARHVASRKGSAAVTKWVNQVLSRLKTLYGKGYDPKRPIVREVFFGAAAPAPGELVALRDRFLANVDPDNPFIVGGKRKAKAGPKAKAAPKAKSKTKAASKAKATSKA